MTERQGSSDRSDWVSGVAAAGPIVLGYLPIGMTFGVLGKNAGLSSFNTMMMSLLVYAGSAQLVAAGLLSAGASAASIILTTFVVNLRHLLLSAAVAPFLKRWNRGELAAFAYQLTDETFALHTARFPSGRYSKAEVFAVNMSAQGAWLAGTGLGILLGQVISDVEPFGLDFVLPALFIALIVLQIEETSQIAVAVITGALSVALLILGVGQWNVIIATVIGATIGVVLELWTNKPSS